METLADSGTDCCYTKALTSYLDHLLRTFLSVTACCAWENIYYPFCRRIRSSRIVRAQQQFLKFHQQQNKPLQTPFEKLGQKLQQPSVHESYLSGVLSYGYRQLETLSPCCQSHSTIKISLQDISPTPPIQKTCTKLLGLERYVTGLYVHGSYAIGDAVPGYSDFDCAAWVRKEVCQSPSHLRTLRRKALECVPAIYFLDYSQHHELFWFSEYDFSYRQTSIYPSILFHEARRICGLSELSIADPVKERKKHEIQFLTILSSILSFTKSNSWHRWYYLKSFLSHISLLPALYYQKNNEIISKPEAITRIKSELPVAREVLQPLTVIRSHWLEWGAPPGGIYQAAVKRSPNLVRYFYSMRRRTPPDVLDHLGRDYQKKISQLIKQLLEGLK